MSLQLRAKIILRRRSELLPTLPPPETWLSPSEQARLSGITHADRRGHYLAGHWLLRCLLAQHLGGTPQHWRLREIVNQPPHIEDSGLYTAISHSGDGLACGVSVQPLGVDLETRDQQRQLRRSAPLLRALDDHQDLDDDTLLRRWVLKEAEIKRRHGSALPTQLAAIQLRRAKPGSPTNLRLISTPHHHLAIASTLPSDIDPLDPHAEVEDWHCGSGG